MGEKYLKKVTLFRNQLIVGAVLAWILTFILIFEDAIEFYVFAIVQIGALFLSVQAA